MRTPATLLAAAVLLLAPAARAQHADARPTARDVASLARAGAPALSPDGRRVAWHVARPELDPDAKPSATDTDAGWTTTRQVWLGPADGSAPPRQLTFGAEPAHSPAFSPDGRTLAFLRAVDGKTRLQLLPLDGGEARVLDTGALEPGAFRFAPDGARIAFTAVPERDEAAVAARWRAGGAFEWESQWESAALWVVPVAGGEPVRLGAGARHVTDFVWAPDGGALAVATSSSADPYEVFNRTALALVRSTDGEVLAELETEPTAIGEVHFAPDGSRIAWTATRGTLSVRNALVVRDLATGATANAAAALDPTLDAFAWVGSDALVACVHERTRTPLVRLAADGSRAEPLGFEGRVVGAGLSVSADGLHAATLTSSRLAAWAPTVVSLESGAWTVVAEVDPQVMEWTGFATELVTWPSPEGPALEGLLAVTPHARPGTPPPLLVLPHGGPDSVTQASFSPWIAYFTARGYSVFQPNYRGGTGYGFEHYAANRGRLGEIELLDIEAGVDALVAAGKADPERLVYGGWSWGGYLTAWTIGHTRRYKAAVAGAAVTDVVGQYVGSDINHGVAAQWEYTGDPWRQTREFDESDPIRYLAGCTTPTLVLHGRADTRVPFSQGLALYRALSDLGVETRLVAFPREPHGFREPAHVEHMLRAWADWYRERVTVD